jgi:hypothetical protein
LLVRGLLEAQSLDLGFRTEGIIAINVGLPVNSYDATRQRSFFASLVSRLQAEAGPEPIGISALMPLGEVSQWTGFAPVGQPGEHPSVRVQLVNAGYFDALAMPIVAGRNFQPGDAEAGAIIVNETLARRFWAGQDAVGKSVQVGQRTTVIAGVVRDSQVNRIGRKTEPMYFTPFSMGLYRGPNPVLLVPAAFASRAVAAVRQAESRAEIATVGLADQVNRALSDSRGAARIAGALGLLALLLATVGVYGVISYSVEQRRKEIGIRLALGARPGEVVTLILKRNSRALLIGLTAGAIMAAAASVVLESELYGASRLDPYAWGAVLALLLFAGLGACVIPARRAVRTDPVRALHQD